MEQQFQRSSVLLLKLIFLFVKIWFYTGLA